MKDLAKPDLKRFAAEVWGAGVAPSTGAPCVVYGSIQWYWVAYCSASPSERRLRHAFAGCRSDTLLFP